MSLWSSAKQWLSAPRTARSDPGSKTHGAAGASSRVQHALHAMSALLTRPMAVPTELAVDARGPHPINDSASNFLAYTMGFITVDAEHLSDVEFEVLRLIDRVLMSGQEALNWIPRPPDVLPHILGCLREEDASLREAAQILGSDPLLHAEVLRLANASVRGGRASITNLEQAMQRLGIAGIRRVVSEALIRPLFDARRQTLLSQAMPRMWEHAQRTSAHMTTMARGYDVQPLDAHLAALTCNIGWIGVIKAIEQKMPSRPMFLSQGFTLALHRKSQVFFAMGLQKWSLGSRTSALVELGDWLKGTALDELDIDLAVLLRLAQAKATEDLMLADQAPEVTPKAEPAPALAHPVDALRLVEKD